jgi:hypothetical protein
MITNAKELKVPVGILNLEELTLKSIEQDRQYYMDYLRSCLVKHANQKFMMFAYHCDGHWVAVIICLDWRRVMYLDSNRGRTSKLTPIQEVIYERVLSSLLLPYVFLI